MTSPEMGHGRVTIMGVAIDAVDEQQAVSVIVRGAAHGSGGLVVTPNLDHFRRLQDDNQLRMAYERADLVVADGMPVVWASWLQGSRLPCRIAGSSLLWSVSRGAAAAGLPIFLVGGRPGAAQVTAERLRAHSPDLVIGGMAAPDLGFERDPQQVACLVDRIRDSGAGIVFLALGTPKQELLAVRLVGALPSTWFVGVGAGFDMAAGQVRRAPDVVQRAGLEWAYRLSQEPKRLFRRYVIEDLPFASRLFVASIKERRRERDH